jgi:hypothetical protein
MGLKNSISDIGNRKSNVNAHLQPRTSVDLQIDLVWIQFIPVGLGNSLLIANAPSKAHTAFEFFALAENWTHDNRGVNQIQKKLTCQVQWEAISGFNTGLIAWGELSFQIR